MKNIAKRFLKFQNFSDFCIPPINGEQEEEIPLLLTHTLTRACNLFLSFT